MAAKFEMEMAFVRAREKEEAHPRDMDSTPAENKERSRLAMGFLAAGCGPCYGGNKAVAYGGSRATPWSANVLCGAKVGDCHE